MWGATGSQSRPAEVGVPTGELESPIRPLFLWRRADSSPHKPVAPSPAVPQNFVSPPLGRGAGIRCCWACRR